MTRDEIRELKEEGGRDIDERGRYGDRGGISFDAGVGSISGGINENGDRGGSIKALGFGVEWGEGGGSVSLPGGIDISTSEQGCYIVQVHSIFGQEAFTNIQKKPECDDDDDNDEGDGEDEDKPPHCIGSDGRPGKGEPKNLLPECLNENESYKFLYDFSSSHYNIYESNFYPGNWQENMVIIKTQIIPEQNIVHAVRIDAQIQTIGPNYPSGTEPSNYNITTESSYAPSYSYYGTPSQFREFLETSGYPSSSKNYYLNSHGNEQGGEYSVWVVAGVAGSGCNPTGEEGCSEKPSPSSSGKSDKDKPHPTGLPKRQKRDRIKRRDKRDEEEMDRCCANVKKIAKVLAVDEILSKGLIIPGRLIATQAKGAIKCETYLDILANQVRIQDHLGIHPIKVAIKDSNKSKEGDQTLDSNFINATASIKQLLELGLESKGDSADRLGILVRIAWICVQILTAITKATRGVQGIMYFIGMPIREKIDKIQMPFDPTLGKREQIKKKAKGFDPNKSESKPSEKEIKDTLELKDEDSLEALLPYFLNTVEQPTLTENYDDESGVTLADLLRLTQRY